MAIPDPPPKSAFERREQAVTDALRSAIRDVFQQTYQAEPKADSLSFRFGLALSPKENWDLRFDPSLREQVARQLEDQEASVRSYQEGRVYCFRCESSVCDVQRAERTPAGVSPVTMPWGSRNGANLPRS